MKVLLIGQGAREHALAWKLAQSPKLEALYCTPGNPGIAEHAQVIEGSQSPDALAGLAARLGVDLVVVGPEAPLVEGAADLLRQKGIAVFGPGKGAAQIEGSKAFSKELMAAAKVPTARFELFTDLGQAAARARAWGPVVVKADGLAAGKGVVVADDGEEAEAAVRALGALPAGRTLVLEERLSGPELSVIALCDGERALLLPPAQDHKQLRDGDRGPNTGGMGAYAPAKLLSDQGLEALRETIFAPVLGALAARGTPFRGALFAGLMLTPQGVRVLEFNCRFGDPEAQVLVLQLEGDLLPLLAQCARGRLEADAVAPRPGASVAVVLAAAGYPGTPVKGTPIFGLDRAPPPGVFRFHGATARDPEGLWLTDGGRVLSICARGESLEAARAAAYAEVERVQFEGRQLRRDIGARRR